MLLWKQDGPGLSYRSANYQFES